MVFSVFSVSGLFLLSFPVGVLMDFPAGFSSGFSVSLERHFASILQHALSLVLFLFVIQLKAVEFLEEPASGYEGCTVLNVPCTESQ